MPRRIVASLAATAALTLMFTVPQVAHADDCKAGSATSLAPNTPTAGDVDNTQTDKFKFTVPAGQTGILHLQMAGGDIDIRVCKNGNQVCYSHHYMGIPDGCGLSDANVTLPETPVTNEYAPLAFGPPLGPGQYRLDVIHCFSSEDEGACDYVDTDPVLGEPLAPGALDDAPPVQYVVALATN